MTLWFAFGVGAVTVWAMPKFWAWVWSVARGWALMAVVIGSVLLVSAPFAFTVERATGWQSGEQERIDHAAFDRITVEPLGPLVFAGVSGQTARYDFALRLGPRSYTNAAGVVRSVDAGPVTIEGRLSAGGAPIAWCTGYVSNLASPNTVRDPKAFLASVQGLNYVDLPVSCTGSDTALTNLCGIDGLTVDWDADAGLVGDRTTQQRQFTGQTQTTLELPAGSGCP